MLIASYKSAILQSHTS